jgi:hypothetical protein
VDAISGQEEEQMQPVSNYPLTFSVEYPDRQLSRVSTFFRIFAAIPILILMSTLVDTSFSYTSGSIDSSEVRGYVAGGAGLVSLPVVLMLLFRGKYPWWWADWNRELLRFSNRVSVYLLLMDDRYPSTDEQQSVQLDFERPDGSQLSRGLPLIKWLLAIPHYLILGILSIAIFFVVLIAWFAILFTGRYPRGLFGFVEGYMRWYNRVVAYSLILITDQYPPFSMEP